MAIGGKFAASVAELVRDHRLAGHFAMLGRQRWTGTGTGANATAFQKYILDRGVDLPSELRTESGYVIEGDQAKAVYSEPFFDALGFTSIDSIDMSDFEGATLIQDLSKETNENLREKFDVIYDGGTCEHVFDIASAFRNIHNMLKPGGTLIAHSPCNN